MLSLPRDYSHGVYKWNAEAIHHSARARTTCLRIELSSSHPANLRGIRAVGASDKANRSRFRRQSRSKSILKSLPLFHDRRAALVQANGNEQRCGGKFGSLCQVRRWAEQWTVTSTPIARLCRRCGSEFCVLPQCVPVRLLLLPKHFNTVLGFL